MKNRDLRKKVENGKILKNDRKRVKVASRQAKVMCGIRNVFGILINTVMYKYTYVLTIIYTYVYVLIAPLSIFK